VSDLSVLVVDDHAIFAEALQARLAQGVGLYHVWVAHTAPEARTAVGRYRPAVVVLDLALGADDGLDVARYVIEASPGSRVMMLTGTAATEPVVAGILAGVRAWLPKTVDTDHLIRVIRAVARGEAWFAPDLLGRVLAEVVTRSVTPPVDPLAALTPRESDVLQCLVDGLSRADIAHRLHLSTNTVRTHTQNLAAKLGAHSALESVALALRYGVRASDG
jgi:DNA-binding NarL/FixJ family response regulator